MHFKLAYFFFLFFFPVWHIDLADTTLIVHLYTCAVRSEELVCQEYDIGYCPYQTWHNQLCLPYFVC